MADTSLSSLEGTASEPYPQPPSNVRSVPSTRAIFLRWDWDPDPDVRLTQVWGRRSEHDALDARAHRRLLVEVQRPLFAGRTPGAFCHEGLAEGECWQYWLRSGHVCGAWSAFTPADPQHGLRAAALPLPREEVPHG